MAITTSIMTGGVNNHPTTSEDANGIATDFVTEGVIGTITNTSGVAPATGAFAVNAQGTPNMTVAVTSGVAYVTGTPSSQNSQTFRVYSTASENVTISANSSGSTKYDWVYIKLDATLLNAPTLAGDTTATLVTSRSTSNSSDDGTPPTYGYPLAVVTVANGASSITNSVIRDIRSNADIGAVAGTNTGWTNGALPQVSSVTENGNRSASITFASTVASILTPGMRIRTTRTVAAPTYMGGAFNGTNHYFTKTTATSTLSTFTDNFTLMAHVEPTSYAQMAIMGRGDATPANGWDLRMEATGQVALYIRSGGAANTRAYTTYQSVPLNKKTAIAVSYTSTGPACVIYFDGISVPVGAAVTSGTAPTTAGTGGDFSIGRLGGFNGLYWTGYISGVGVFNAVLSAATIRSYKNQALTGSETNCIGAWSLNNTGVNQQASGTNDVTATNSVGYTSGRSPYCMDANGTAAGTYDYAIVTKVSTTVATVQYPEGCAIPTSGGISAVDYSGVKAPFGMPTQGDRWLIETQTRADESPGFGALNLWTASNHKITVPVGNWLLGWQGTVSIDSTVAGTRNGQIALTGTTNLPVTNGSYQHPLSVMLFNSGLSSISWYIDGTGKTVPISLSTAETFTLAAQIVSATGSETWGVRGGRGVVFSRAILTYL